MLLHHNYSDCDLELCSRLQQNDKNISVKFYTETRIKLLLHHNQLDCDSRPWPLCDQVQSQTVSTWTPFSHSKYVCSRRHFLACESFITPYLQWEGVTVDATWRGSHALYSAVQSLTLFCTVRLTWVSGFVSSGQCVELCDWFSV